MTTTRTLLVAFSFLALSSLAAIGCGGGSDTPDTAITPPIDAGDVPDAPPGAPDAMGTDAGCFDNPTTHVEIINACTDAEKIDKTPVLPLLNPDGTLPPLPPP